MGGTPVTFQLFIPGRDPEQKPAAANTANPLTASPGRDDQASMNISGLAKLAPPQCEGTACSSAGELQAALPRRPAVVTMPSEYGSDAEAERYVKRHARFVWLGYIERADDLAEILLQRDRRIDDRRLCVECVHARPGRVCTLKQGFLTDYLRRCPHFKPATTPY